MLGQVVSHIRDTTAKRPQTVHIAFMAFSPEARQLHGDGPAFGGAMDVLNIAGLGMCSENTAGLVLGQAQLVGRHFLHPAFGFPAGQGPGRAGAAGDHQIQPGCCLFKQRADYVIDFFAGHAVIVVQQQRDRVVSVRQRVQQRRQGSQRLGVQRLSGGQV